MPRRLLLCLTPIALLTGCALFPNFGGAEKPARHYRGMVRNANTGAPVARAVVTAEYHYFGTTYLLPEEYIGFTLSQEDGSFDLTVPGSKKPVNHLEARANLPLPDDVHPRRGQITSYTGVLNHVSTQRTNTILVR